VRYYFVLLASRGGCDHRVFACGSLVSLRSLALRSNLEVSPVRYCFVLLA